MFYDSFRHHRRSIRMKGYDYASEGAYFVTICTQFREHFFGEIMEGQMRLNDAGKMIEKWWCKLSENFSSVQTDENILMPNHFHGIIWIVGADPRVCPQMASLEGEHMGSPLHRVIQWFKTMTTNQYICGVKQNRWPVVPKKLWQRNYFERIIRNEEKLNQTRQYIVDNPKNWEKDCDNISDR